MSQVSELSHKLGTVEGNCRSMEEELSRLQNQNVQLGKSKSEREVDANELRARLRSADEKVHISCLCRASQHSMCTPVLSQPGCLMSHHKWLHTPDCEVLLRRGFKMGPFQIRGGVNEKRHT